jgi:hypothetical protein
MLRPITINGFTFGVNPGVEYVAREDATGIEKKIQIAPWQGGYYEAASDGRYVSIASVINQGKAGIDDLVLAVFDCQAKAWMNYGALPPASLWHPVSGPANPFWLWIKNGGQVAGFPRDAGGQIGRVGFVSASEIEWVTTEPVDNTTGNFSYKLWRRTFSPANGDIMPFAGAVSTWPTNLKTAIEPVWF